MRKELILSGIEINKRRTLKWDKAWVIMDKMTEKKAMKIALNAEQGNINYKEGKFDPIQRLRKALTNVECGWRGDIAGITTMGLSKTILLIAGGTSNGDTFNNMIDIEYFVRSGMARGVGFRI